MKNVELNQIVWAVQPYMSTTIITKGKVIDILDNNRCVLQTTAILISGSKQERITQNLEVDISKVYKTYRFAAIAAGKKTWNDDDDRKFTHRCC